MLNEDRVILMTKLASYEAREGKKDKAVGNFFRSDYVGVQMLWSIVSAAISFVIIFALYLLYDFETFMGNIYKMDLFVFAQTVLVWFLVVVVGYALISYVIFSVKYSRAKKSQKNYYNNLKKLSSMYDERE